MSQVWAKPRLVDAKSSGIQESGRSVSCALGHDGFIESSDLDGGTYLFEELFVDQRAVPNTRAFHLPFRGMEFSIEPGQVNVLGEMVITIDQSGKSKIEFNYRVEDVKAHFATKAPESQWLSKPWRSVFPAS